MQSSKSYCDLSLITKSIIDIDYFINKIKLNGFSILALDTEISDPKSINVSKPEINKSFTIPSLSSQQQPRFLTIYNRLTLIIESTINLHPLNQQQVPYQCDIMAIRPTNQKIFHALCTEYHSYDLITFDIGIKLPYMLKRNPVYEAIRKGKYFEVYYQPLFNQQTRVIALTNILNIIKATNGKNLIISSHTGNHSTHRSPYDVAALFMSLGMSKDAILRCMQDNCYQVIRAGQHRRYLKGAIKEIPPSIGIKINRRIRKCREDIRKLNKCTKKEQEKIKNMQQVMKQ